ncbi:metallophosphoesterase [Yoonia sp. R2331]|uniref:metallophosphoesterase n=1 Tax=Yoonia sp. R2331 TaxID=3237238 RepID=UPI0034E5D7F6
MRLMKRLWPARQSNRTVPISVDPPCFVIGDVHGCADLLAKILDRAPPDADLICVGDYVDRGDHSADVLGILQARPDITCLMGNHEAMMLKFLDNPIGPANRWLRFGGLQTLASFGVTGGAETDDPDQLTRLSEALRTAMGTALIDWLRDLPCQTLRGNVMITHAGADPALAPADQDDKVLIWGHPDFAKRKRDDGLWVLHGHTIVNMPEARNGRIAIDTGAYATGRLTAAHLTPQGCTFVEVDRHDD